MRLRAKDAFRAQCPLPLRWKHGAAHGADWGTITQRTSRNSSSVRPASRPITVAPSASRRIGPMATQRRVNLCQMWTRIIPPPTSTVDTIHSTTKQKRRSEGPLSWEVDRQPVFIEFDHILISWPARGTKMDTLGEVCIFK